MYTHCCSAPHDSGTWPPRFHKLLLQLSPRRGELAGATCGFAYCDARRFGRIKLCEGDPADSETIKKLGFDPLTDMPDLQAFKVSVNWIQRGTWSNWITLCICRRPGGAATLCRTWPWKICLLHSHELCAC